MLLHELSSDTSYIEAAVALPFVANHHRDKAEMVYVDNLGS